LTDTRIHGAIKGSIFASFMTILADKTAERNLAFVKDKSSTAAVSHQPVHGEDADVPYCPVACAQIPMVMDDSSPVAETRRVPKKTSPNSADLSSGRVAGTF